MITLSPIAALHAHGRVQGDARIAGTITAVERHTNAAGNHSSVATLTDDTGSIDLHVYPRVWLNVHHLLHEGAHVSVDGLLHHVGGQLTIICTSLSAKEQQ